MLKTAAAVALTLVVAVGGGAASLAYVLDEHSGLGALTIGQWTAYPRIGTVDADPYSKARISREGLLALGPAEGLAFTATRDSEGRRLLRQCAYAIAGQAPQARFWTLFARAPGLKAEDGAGPPATTSRGLLRNADDGFTLTISPTIAPGNWLRTAGNGTMELVLTVYDAGVATGTDITQAAMPTITRTGCDA